MATEEKERKGQGEGGGGRRISYARLIESSHLTIPFEGRYYHHPHFIDKKNKAERWQVTCPRSHRKYTEGSRFTPRTG